jgi:hypothetical protein
MKMWSRLVTMGGRCSGSRLGKRTSRADVRGSYGMCVKLVLASESLELYDRRFGVGDGQEFYLEA